MSDVNAGPNTLTLYQARLAGTDDGFHQAVLYVEHITAALESPAGTTVVSLSNGERVEVDMPLERFVMRQRLDKVAS
ncbi:MAG: hypothetical protein AAF253_10280 [Pseudomonadota bacterium]